MSEWSGVGKVLAFLGLLLLILGGLVTLLGKLPNAGGLGWLGKLPGDVSIKRDNFTFYFPLATSLIVSVVLSLVLFILSTLMRR